MMNDPQVIEAAKYFAFSLLTGENFKNSGESISLGFRNIVSRNAKPQELEILLDYYESELLYFEENPDKIDALMGLGDYQLDEIEKQKEWAALSQTILLIYNMEEVIIRA